MNESEPCLVWRDGKPRFVPSPALRAFGIKGQSLKHPDGTWFTREEAAAACFKLYHEAKQSKHESEHKPTTAKEHTPKWRKLKQPNMKRTGSKKGFVYAIILDDKIKIGFSENPWKRIAGIMVALPVAPVMLAIPGTMQDEKMLHWQNRDHHLEGEWFRYTPIMEARMIKLFRLKHAKTWRKMKFETPAKQTVLKENLS